MTKDKLVELARSFSFKLNVGNYQSRDFFCSQKAECSEKDAEKVSEKLHDFCRNEVMKSVATYQFDNEPKRADEKKAVKQGSQFRQRISQETQIIEEGREENKESEANQRFAQEVDNLNL